MNTVFASKLQKTWTIFSQLTEIKLNRQSKDNDKARSLSPYQQVPLIAQFLDNAQCLRRIQFQCVNTIQQMGPRFAPTTESERQHWLDAGRKLWQSFAANKKSKKETDAHLSRTIKANWTLKVSSKSDATSKINSYKMQVVLLLVALVWISSLADNFKNFFFQEIVSQSHALHTLKLVPPPLTGLDLKSPVWFWV